VFFVLSACGILLSLPIWIFITVTLVSAAELADRVLGQDDFVHSGIDKTKADSLALPSGVAIDAWGHLYVADSGNNRVLGWLSASSFTNGAAAEEMP
jgi:hypothetical protein